MSRMFGTDGVRGVANDELTPSLAMQLGMAGAFVLSRRGNAHRPTILVGCDTRLSGDMLASALMAGACSVGANVIYLGVLPTPAVAFLAKKHHADAGVVISASHNPMEFNGIKFFDGNGFKLPDAVEDEIEAQIKSNMADITFPTGEGVGRIEYRFEAYHEYVEHAVETVPVDLTGMKLVVDTAEGASYRTNIDALTRLGATVIPIHNDPNGTNINKNCGSTHLESLKETVLKEKADAGFAFDGDADRFLAIDETGKEVNGDQIMAILGLDMKKRGDLKKNTITVTVMTNLGFYLMGKEQGIQIDQTKVGDRYVLEHMQEIGGNIGGEQSGHIILLDENTTGDGLLSALHLARVMAETKKPLSELSSVCRMYPQALVNAKVANTKKEHYTEYPEIMDRIHALEAQFDGKGRVLIRPSGTEPLVRVMIEGEDQQEIQKKAEDLAAFIEKTMA
ncbi:MAG: phosphoglucosamine mutase [Lachnospiraceae bacterium]|jgi:phosphoglucosamine mutase